jgi:hypothetical protein
MQSLAVEFLHQSIQGVLRFQIGDQVELVLQSFQLGGEQLDFRFATRPPAARAKILGIPVRASKRGGLARHPNPRGASVKGSVRHAP